MNFLSLPGTPFYRAELRAQALEIWRSAERLVADRWCAYLDSAGEARPHVFAAYVAALDAEAAAADDLARLTLREAA
jgi:hypothetical protein